MDVHRSEDTEWAGWLQSTFVHEVGRRAMVSRVVMGASQVTKNVFIIVHFYYILVPLCLSQKYYTNFNTIHLSVVGKII